MAVCCGIVSYCIAWQTTKLHSLTQVLNLCSTLHCRMLH